MEEEIFNWNGRLGPMELHVSPTTFIPSTVTTLLAQELVINDGDSVIDVGCGTGILAILAAKLGATRVSGVDQSPDVVEVASGNAARHHVANRTTFYQGDLFAPLPDDLTADVIIGDVSGIPDILAECSGWFPSGKGGGTKGSELPIKMLRDAVFYLSDRGRLFLPTGTLQDEQSILDAANSIYRNVRLLSERRIPFPANLAESDAVKKLVDSGIISITARGSRYFWEARIWELSAPA